MATEAATVVIPPDIKRTLLFRQMGFLFAIAASVALGVYVVLWSQTPNYSLLYGNMSDQDASQVVEALQKSGIDFKLDHASGAIMVPSAMVHDARMKLAADGLPKSASYGFSMLNEEQKLGTSQFIEKARYQHALENELARSISKVSAIRSARVHLALPKETVFLRNRKSASASVLLDLYQGHRLESGQVAAIANLVAASVPSLDMNNVSIVDQHGRLMTNTGASADLAITASQFQYTQELEDAYMSRIENILMPILGHDGVKAQVTAELDFTHSEQTRESYNPDAPAIRSERLEEDVKSTASVGGVPGALSNQPALDGSAPEVAPENNSQTGGSASPGSTAKRTTRNYELDKTISHTRSPVGTLNRLSVAVVVNHKKQVNDQAEIIWVEHSPEELNQFEQLVKEAIGFNAMRGDTVNVMNARFNQPEVVAPLPATPVWQEPWVWDAAKQILGGMLVLFIVFGMLRPALKNIMPKDLMLPQSALADGGQLASEQKQVSQQMKEMKALEIAPEYDKSIHNVKEMVTADPKLAAQVVRNWVGEE